MHLTHTVKIKKNDGTTAEHTAEAIRFVSLSVGAVSVAACCCGLQDMISYQTIYEVADMDEAAIRQEVLQHVERVARHHGSVYKATEVLAGLVKIHAQGG